jgi:sugar phosphate permease
VGTKNRNTILLMSWLMYGLFYLNRLNISPVIPLIRQDLGFSYTQIGFITAAFYGLYTVTQLPAGYLGDRLGPRKVITLGGLISSVANLVFSQLGSLPFLAAFHALNGTGQGGGWSPSVKLLVNWFPRQKLGTTLGIYTTCVSVFTIGAYMVSGYLGKHFGWRLSFLVPALILAAFCPFYWRVVRDAPGQVNPRDLAQPESPRTIRGDFSLLIRHRQLWVTFVSFFCLLYIQFGGMIWYPTYLQGTFGIDVFQAGTLVSVFPLMGLIARPLGGILSDRLFHGRRKPLILLGMAAMTICLFFQSVARELWWAVLLLAGVGFFFQLFNFLFFTLPSVMLPLNLVSTGSGFLDTGGHLGSLLAMFLSGWFIDRFGSYRVILMAFWVMGVIGFLSALFIREERRSPQDSGEPRQHPYPFENQ